MKRLLISMLGVGVCATAAAQIRLGEGTLTGSFETNSIYYVDDSGLGDAGVAPSDRFGSNNYLKVDYNYGRFSAGLQADAYLPALQGYEIGQQVDGRKFYLSSKYIQWQDRHFSALVGDIFDQYGNGLIFRSYEDRQLGFNNSIEGIRGSFNFNNYVVLKGMYGRPRLYTEYADSWVRGLDLRISLTDIFDWQSLLMTFEGSYINRYQSLDKDPALDFSMRGLTSPNLNMYSGRMNLDWKGLTFRGEYVAKGKDIGTAVAEKAEKGNAIYGELGYNGKKMSLSGTFRSLDRMGTMLSLYGTGTGNTLNYLPALTRQYTYMLANLNPYQVNVEGEIGGQIDAYYSLRNKSDRYRYWIFHANFSTFYTLHDSQSITGKRELLWRDLNFDLERQWNRKWKTSFLFSYQEWNPYHGFRHRTYVSNVFVADVTYKIDRKKSIRAEVQYLLSDEYEGDWVAGLLEFSVAPRWSIFFSDMYNIDKTAANGYKSINYYNGGASYTKNRTRIQLSYGRNRAGYICSGGVCRYSPAYTGLNLVLTSSF